MTGIRPKSPIDGHVREKDADWEPIDLTPLVELARTQAPDLPDLPARLARIDRGAWECDAYVRFLPSRRVKGRLLSWVLEADGEEFVMDIDEDGQVVGMELLHIAMSDVHT